MALTSLAIKKAKPRDKAYKMFDEGGLFLLSKHDYDHHPAED